MWQWMNMDPLLYSGVKWALSWADSSRWSRSKRQKTQISAGKTLDAQGILFIDYLEKRSNIHSKNHIALFVRLQEEITKKRLQIKKKNLLSSSVVSQVDRDDSKTTWIPLRISPATLCSRSGLLWPLAVCGSQKNATEKEIWLQWRNDNGNWGIF